jgi:hypothetical protein
MRIHGPYARPAPRTVSALKNDPGVAADLREHAVALIALPVAVHAD